MKHVKLFFALFAMLALGVTNAWAQTVTWEKATSIAAGDVVVLVCESKTMELSGISTTSTKYGIGETYTSTPAGKYELTVEAGSSYGTFSFKNGSAYLYWFSGNSLNKTTTKNKNASWKVTFSSGNATILNAKDNTRKLQWNASSPRFACYTGAQTAVQLYKKVISDEPADVIVKTLKSIAVEGATTDYETGDIFKFDGTCTATYNVTKNDVAQEDETKVVTPTLVSTPDMSTAGEKEVTVTYTEDDVTVTATYTITVTENVITAGEYKLALNNTFFGCGTGNNETEQLKKSNDILVTAGCLSSASSKTYYHANHVRFYADSYLKLSVPEGYVINSIVFTADGDWKGSISVNAGTYTDDTKSWAGSVQEVVFSFGAQNRIATATVTYEALADDVTYDYYIAGTENLTGFNWSANGLGMEKDGDVYKHTFRELNSGIYEFKITDGQFNSEGDKTHEHTTLGAAYEEVSYNDGNIKIITEEAINLTVIFDATAGKITFEGLTLKRYTVEATVNPAEVGTIEGAGTYTHGAEATLTATPAEGYKFVNWTVGEETIADNPYKFAVTAEVALVANFEKLTHTVNATATNGTVTGAGTYNHGAEVTLTATPAFDYEFEKWSNGATENPLTITVEKNIELQAIFAEVAATEVKESGKFSISAHKTATFATGNLQYHTSNKTWRFAKQQYQVVGEQNIEVGNPDFKGWIDMFGWSTSETYFGVDPSNSNELYDGEFVEWGNVFEDETWSTLSADEWKYLLNTRANATQLKQIATIDTILGIMLFPDAWVMPEGIEVAAKLDTNYNVNVYNYTVAQWDALEDAGAIFLPAAGRRTGGYGNMINYDQQVETREDYLVNGGFYRWQDNTNIYCYYWTSTINEDKNVSYLHNIVALGNDEYTIGTGTIWGEKGRYGQSVRLAKVAYDTHTVEVTAENGTVEGAGTYEHGATATLTAVANDGYEFLGWTVDDKVVSTDESYTFEVTSDMDIVANFDYVYEFVYFVNASRWENVYAYVWNETGNNEWPGVQLEKAEYQLYGFDVYGIGYPELSEITHIIFNNGHNGEGNQTADLDWTPDNYYIIDRWYSEDELINPPYTATGSSADLFGTAWDPTNTDNDLTLQEDGTYRLVKENVILAAGNIEYKVAVHHSWNWYTYPEVDNAVLTIETAGTYHVTFTLNVDTEELTAVATLVTPSTPTALDNINTSVAPVKAFVNGQLIIIKNGIQYNAQGQVVK